MSISHDKIQNKYEQWYTTAVNPFLTEIFKDETIRSFSVSVFSRSNNKKYILKSNFHTEKLDNFQPQFSAHTHIKFASQKISQKNIESTAISWADPLFQKMAATKMPLQFIYTAYAIGPTGTIICAHQTKDTNTGFNDVTTSMNILLNSMEPPKNDPKHRDTPRNI
jgi:hypothetical protein